MNTILDFLKPDTVLASPIHVVQVWSKCRFLTHVQSGHKTLFGAVVLHKKSLIIYVTLILLLKTANALQLGTCDRTMGRGEFSILSNSFRLPRYSRFNHYGNPLGSMLVGV